MENLLALAYSRAWFPFSICIIGFGIIGFILIQKWKRSKHGDKKAFQKSEAITFVLMILIFGGNGLIMSGNYLLDACNNAPITEHGIVSDVRFTKYSKRMSVYQVVFHPESKEPLILEIAISQYENYSIVPGQRYCVQYYPRTNALCSIHLEQ